jgi:hypothetical protein
LNDINIIGKCQGVNRNFTVTIPSEQCNDLILQGPINQAIVTIVANTPAVDQPSTIGPLCSGTPVSAITFTGSPLPNTTYHWSATNAIAIGMPSASGTGDIPAFTAVNTTSAPITSTITVTPRTTCDGASKTFTITVDPVSIPTPVIYSESGGTVICQKGSGIMLKLNTTYIGTSITYQWYKGNTPIPDANAKNYYATEPGNYSIRVTVDSCSAQSAMISVTKQRCR